LTGGAALVACVASGLVLNPAAASAVTPCTSKCVILIQINGLEPKDITKQNTPVLWALAHSGDSTNDPAANAALTGRNGWSWQAARDVMSTGDGPSTWALLTGDTAEQSGDTADLFAAPKSDGGLKWFATGGASDGSCDQNTPCDPSVVSGVFPGSSSGGLGGSSVLSVAVDGGKQVGIENGDPALCKMLQSGVQGAEFDKSPVNDESLLQDVSGGCPELYSPVPTGPPSSPAPGGWSQYCPPPSVWPTQPAQEYPNVCPATDAQVVGQAMQDFNGNGTYPDVTFIDLPEIGLVKQRSGDSDCFHELHCGDPLSPTVPDSGLPSNSPAPPAEPAAVSHALHSTDALLGTFFGFLEGNQSTSTSWSATYVMVVGSHGYEATPAPLRVPDPDCFSTSTSTSTNTSNLPVCNGVAAAQGTASQTGPGDLSTFVATEAKNVSDSAATAATLVPQGTFATVYYTGTDPSQEGATLKKLFGDLCGSLDSSIHPKCSTKADNQANSNLKVSPVNQACEQLYDTSEASGALGSGAILATPDCIENVYYVDPGAAPSDAPFNEFLFGQPGDPGYPTQSDPSYDPNPHCQSTDPGGLFFDPTKNCDPNLLQFYEQQHPSWHLNVLDSHTVTPDPRNPAITSNVFNPTGTGGQLVVELAPGWAAGPLANLVVDTSTVPQPSVSSPSDPVDPYAASTGGPRDRAVAAIVNGPSSGSGSSSVVQFPDSNPQDKSSGDGLAPFLDPHTYPQSWDSSTDTSKYVCDSRFMLSHAAFSDNPSGGTTAVDQANADPADDTAALGSPVFKSELDSFAPQGSECQAQTIDFAPTIEAIQGIGSSSSQKNGNETSDNRFLDEAFTKCLGGNTTNLSGPICGNTETKGNPTPPKHQAPPPVVEPPPVKIYVGPKPPKPYDFHGLIRNIEAQVVDQRNHTVADAAPGTYLSSLRITADFGKDNSAVTITLYKRSSAAADHPHDARTPLTAIVRFCPFIVPRDPNVELRFVVPTTYQPDHVGLAVREARKLNAATAPGCTKGQHSAFIAVGPMKGAIVPILDAPLLHKLKPCPVSLTVHLPHGHGNRVQSVVISRAGHVVRRIPGWRARGARLVIPADRLPGGTLQVDIHWLSLHKRKLVSRSTVTNFHNCTAAQRKRLGLF
jgi:hypothetical protein